MAKKESWMKKGNPVIALAKPGVITNVIENEALEQVFHIDVRLKDQKHAGRYHVSDVKDIE